MPNPKPVTKKAADAFIERILRAEFAKYGKVALPEPCSVEWTLRRNMHRHVAGSILCDHRNVCQLGTSEADARIMGRGDAVRMLMSWPASQPCWCLWTGARWMAVCDRINSASFRCAIDGATEEWRKRVEAWRAANPKPIESAPSNPQGPTP